MIGLRTPGSASTRTTAQSPDAGVVDELLVEGGCEQADIRATTSSVNCRRVVMMFSKLRRAAGKWKLDESCISEPKTEISNWTVQFEISVFGFQMQDLSNFHFFHSHNCPHDSYRPPLTAPVGLVP